MDTTDTTDTTDEVRFTVRVPKSVAHRMNIAAAYENKSRQQWILEALVIVLNRVEYLREEEA